MKKLESDKSKVKLRDCLGSKINHHLNGLDKFNQSDSQKILELCQVGKFLCSYFPEYEITESREQPDFIISDGKKKIGLEHQSIFVDEILKRTGFFKNIALLTEREFEKDERIPNFLVNCYIKNDIEFSNKNKDYILNTFLTVISEFVLNDVFLENNVIDDIYKMPHSQKSVNVNFGGYMVPELSKERLLEAIEKKEKKVKDYAINTDSEQWLLLLIGGVGAHSYYLRQEMELNIETDFKKIFLMEDFDNRLYEIK